jgi:hypothetical protein
LTRLELQIGQMQQQQHDQFTQARELSQQAAADLAAVKQSLGMQPQAAAAVKLPGVEDEAKPSTTSAPAKTSKASKTDKKPTGGSSVIGRTLRVIVLLAIVFLFFKFLARWQAGDEMDEDARDDPDETHDASQPVPSAAGAPAEPSVKPEETE